MKKILIVPLNTDLNRGDQALVWESARVVREVYPNDTVEISLIEVGNSKEEVERQSWQTRRLGYRLMDPVLKHPGRYFLKDSVGKVNNGVTRIVKWGLVALFDFLRSFPLLVRYNFVNRIAYLSLSKRAKDTVQLMRNVDAVYVKGGGLIHAYGKITDLYQMYYSTFMMLLAIRYHKPLYFLPNSIGPVKGRLTRKLITYVLKQSIFISVREQISLKYLRENLRISCECYADLGYHLQDMSGLSVSDYICTDSRNQRKIVGITLRPWRFPEAQDPLTLYNNYVLVFTQFVNYLCSEGYAVYLFVHTLGPSAHENDEIAVWDVYNKVFDRTNCHVIKDPGLNCYDMMKLYSHCTYFVGTRFHSVIFAQNQGVPTIAISYGGNKGEGIMKDIGLSQFVIGIDNLSYIRLVEAFDSLKDQSEHYKMILEKHNKQMALDRERLISDLKKMLKQ